MNKRVEETILGSGSTEGQENKDPDYRILPKHMYGVSFGIILRSSAYVKFLFMIIDRDLRAREIQCFVGCPKWRKIQ